LSGTVLSILLVCGTPFLGGIFVLLLFAQIARGWLQGVVQPMMFSTQAKAVGRYRQGAVVGLRQTMNRLSSIVIPPVMGVIADWWSASVSFVVLGSFLLLLCVPIVWLTRRAATPEIGRKLVERIRWWEEYCARNGGEMNNNPSPGNKAGGLTTILEKSLGAAAKGGTTALNEVYKYAEPVTAKGFVFMDTPGYDPVSATGQVAGGANVLAFTTGRGSAYGCKPTPSVKLATNNDTYRRMIEDMDINCGDVVDGVSIADKGREIFDKILAVASGERTKSELLGYGDAEFTPWQIGATM